MYFRFFNKCLDVWVVLRFKNSWIVYNFCCDYFAQYGRMIMPQTVSLAVLSIDSLYTHNLLLRKLINHFI